MLRQALLAAVVSLRVEGAYLRTACDSHGSFPLVEGIATSYDAMGIVRLARYALPTLLACRSGCDGIAGGAEHHECVAVDSIHPQYRISSDSCSADENS